MKAQKDFPSQYRYQNIWPRILCKLILSPRASVYEFSNFRDTYCVSQYSLKMLRYYLNAVSTSYFRLMWVKYMYISVCIKSYCHLCFWDKKSLLIKSYWRIKYVSNVSHPLIKFTCLFGLISAPWAVQSPTVICVITPFSVLLISCTITRPHHHLRSLCTVSHRGQFSIHTI